MADADTPAAPGWGVPLADAGRPENDAVADTVSREELKKVIAERDAYKRRLRQFQKQAEGLPSDPDGHPPAEPSPSALDGRTREEILRRQIAEKDRTIGRLLVDNEIAAAAARLGAHDPKAVVKLTRDLFAVRDGRVQLSDAVEDAGLPRFDDAGQERALPSVVAEFLAQNDYLVRPAGAQGAGSRSRGPSLPVPLRGMTPQRYALLTPAEKDAVRRMAGIPGRAKVW